MPAEQSPQDYEAELAEARQEERLRQLKEEQDEKKGGGALSLKTLKGLKGGLGGLAKEAGKQELKAIAKQGTKRIMVQLLRWLAVTIATLWPYILIGILIIIVIIFVMSCYENSIECGLDIGEGTLDLIKGLF